MSVHNPYEVHPRKPLTSKQKLMMFIAHDGVCALCGCKIDNVRDAWDEHMDPLWRNGSNDLHNRRPVHVRCARAKTAAEAHMRAKGQRVAEAHFGAKTSANPMPGSRRSKWKKKMNGEWVRR